MDVIWKDIKGYEGLYQVSNLGDIKSIEREIIKKMFGGGVHSYVRKEIILKHGVCRGYAHVSLCKDGNIKQFKVSRLVLSAFKNEPINKDMQCNHIDGNTSNNHIDNLEWTTPQENQIHKAKNLMKNKKSKYVFITQRKDSSKWVLRGYNSKFIGSFDTEEEAYSEYLRLYNLNKYLFINTKETK